MTDDDHAGTDRLAVEQHRAGTAGTLAAARLRTRQAKILAQYPEQRTIRRQPHLARRTVDLDAAQLVHRATNCDDAPAGWPAAVQGVGGGTSMPSRSSSALIRSRSSRLSRHCSSGLVFATSRIVIPPGPRL